MTTPFPFQSAATLLASQLNAITTLPVSTKTATYVLTVADVGYRIVMNSASATTITVNTSIFGASDKVEILNIGAGVCTVTAGTCTVGTSGSLALAQNAGGTLTFISASASVFTASGVTASAGGLTLISSTSLASGTTSVNNCFSSTYMNYMLVLSDCNTSAQAALTFRFRVGGVDSSTGYYSVALESTYSGGLYSSRTANNGTAVVMPIVQTQTTAKSGGTIFMQQPFSATTTSYQFLGADHETTRGVNNGSGFHNVATSYDGFSLILSTGTFSNGTIKVYGLANS